MSEDRDRRPDEGEERIAAVLRRAGPRPLPPEVTMARLRAKVEAEWEGAVRRATARRRRRLALVAAIAATVVLGLFAMRGLRRGGGPAAALARVELRAGSVSLRPPLGSPGAGLVAGTRIESAAGGRAALRMAGGQSVRLDVDTSVVLVSSEVLALEQGRVYVDSGIGGAGRPLTVRTRLGEVRDVGTQFVVELDGSRLRLGVREGRVGVRRDGASHEAAAGQELTLGPDGEASLRAVLPHGAGWDWIASITPTPEIDGRTLSEFLGWVNRETGRAVVFGDADTARRSAEIVLSGSIDGLAPDQALDAVLATCDLTRHVAADRFVIEAPREGLTGE